MYPIYKEVSHIMNARPEQIDTILSEYRYGQGALLQKPYFIVFHRQENVDNLENPVHIQLSLAGIRHEYYEFLNEPMPFRLIVEYDAHSDSVVIIVVETTNISNKTRVTISTISTSSPNFAAFIEHLFIPKSLRHIYNQGLQSFSHAMKMPQ